MQRSANDNAAKGLRGVSQSSLFYVVKSAVQFVVFLFIFWLIRSFADPTYTFSSIIVRGPLHTLLLFTP